MPPVLVMEGKRFVLVEEAEYRRLVGRAARPAVHRRRLPDGRVVETVDALPAIHAGIGRTIRNHRRKAGMGQLELAAAAGVRPETVSRIERGHANPTMRTIEKLLRAMGLDPEKG